MMVYMFTTVMILLGVVSFLRLPVDLMPETQSPTLSVRAEYPGVAPEEVENLVARPLESSLSAAPGIYRINSTSSEGSANIRIQFDYGVNMDEAANEIRTRLDRARSARRRFAANRLQIRHVSNADHVAGGFWHKRTRRARLAHVA